MALEDGKELFLPLFLSLVDIGDYTKAISKAISKDIDMLIYPCSH